MKPLKKPGPLRLAGVGYMFDSAQRSYITQQVAPDEQGALQGVLLSVQLLCNAFGSSLSNLCFSFFISDAFVEVVGFKYPGGQFLISALCMLLAAANTKHALASPALAAHDKVRQKAGGKTTAAGVVAIDEKG